MIGKRGSRYWARVYVKGKVKWLGTFATELEARKAELTAMEDAASLSDETCGHFADRWLDDYNVVVKGAKPRWGAKTVADMRYALKGFKERFGEVPLARFDSSQARPWAAEQPRRYVQTVRTMFSDAVRDGLARSNPFANLRLPQSRGRADIMVLTEPELESLIDTAEREWGKRFGASFAAMVAVAGYTGIRPGELFALEPKDISTARLEINVRQSFNGHELKAPKNGKPRLVVLPPPAITRLAAMPRKLSGRWLFETPKGGQFRKTTLDYYWRPVRSAFESSLDPVRAAELKASRGGKPFHWYELRHTAATLLLERGMTADDVGFQLGHADGILVSRLYGHPADSGRRERIKQAWRGPTPLRVVDEDAEAADG